MKKLVLVLLLATVCFGMGDPISINPQKGETIKVIKITKKTTLVGSSFLFLWKISPDIILSQNDIAFLYKDKIYLFLRNYRYVYEFDRQLRKAEIYSYSLDNRFSNKFKIIKTLKNINNEKELRKSIFTVYYKNLAQENKRYRLSQLNDVYKNIIAQGMTKEEVILSWGNPDDINKLVGSWGVQEQFVYNGSYVYFENGILTSWQS